jgi:hemerythrin-like domain-containing protein
MPQRRLYRRLWAAGYMPRLLDDLQRDHRNMRALLDIIEEELGVLQSGRAPDFDLLAMIMEYTLNYPQIIHHPHATAGIDDLIQEHAKLAELTQRFAAAIANVARGIELQREWFDVLAREYLARNRAHMEREEHDLFPRALAALTDEDWAQLDDKRGTNGDPIFGEKVAAAYEHLYQRILQLHI